MKIYGVCNHSPDYIVTWLRKFLKVSPSTVSIVPEGNILPKRSSGKTVYLFLSKKTFKANLERLNSKAYALAAGFVFTDPLSVNDFVNVTPLDFAESTDIHLDAFLLTKPDKKIFDFDLDSAPVTIERSNYLEKVLARVCSFNSLLNPLMSFIYTLPSASHQKPIKEIICQWLFDGGSEESLEGMLDRKSNSLPLSDKQRERIRNILYTDDGATYKQALAVVKKYDSDDKVPYRELVSSFNVSAYDLRYIQAIVRASAGK